MTMHDAQNPRELALLVLDEIYERGAYANLALNKALRGNGLSSLDRKLCTELVYGTVKTTGTLDWYLCRVINRPFGRWHLVCAPSSVWGLSDPLSRTYPRFGRCQ